MPRRALMLATALALAAATLAAYHGLLANDFVNYDDDLYITGAPEVRAGLTRDSVEWAFSTFQGANWFPLTRLSWMLDAELHGLSPRAFHATSLALHVANVLLALVAFTRLTGSLGIGAFTAGVFALHPLHVESVAWAAARKDVLSGLFWMLGLVAYERWANRGASRLRGAAVASCLVLGLLAKPVVVVLPFMLLLLDAWPLRRLEAADGRGWDRARVRRALLEKAGLLAIVALFGALVIVAQHSGGAVASLESLPLGVRLRNVPVAYATYLRRAFLPTDLAVFYPHPGNSLAATSLAAALALLLCISAVVVQQRRRRPQLAVGWLWWLITLAPTIGILQVGQAALADRYTYLAQSGLVLALAATLAPLAVVNRATRLAAGVLSLASLLALGVVTSAQVRTWKDSETLFMQALRVTQHNHVAHIGLALEHLERHELDRAAAHLLATLRMLPAHARAHGLLGRVRIEQDRPVEAQEQFEMALRSEPDSSLWLSGLADAQLASKRPQEALANLDAALRVAPKDPSLHVKRGLTLLGIGRVEEAVASLEHAVELTPGSALLHAHLGRALASEERLDAALAQLDDAVRLDPSNAEFAALRARLLDRLGRSEEAIAAYREALHLGARAHDLLNNLAWLLATSGAGGPGASGEAVALAEEAVAAQAGEDARALDTLAQAYTAAGRRQDAQRAAERALALADAAGDSALAAQIRERLARSALDSLGAQQRSGDTPPRIP